MGISLRNKTARALGPFDLPHAEHCADGTCRCTPLETFATERDPATGEQGRVAVTKGVCRSVFFAAGGRVDALEATVLECPKIARALARGELEKV